MEPWPEFDWQTLINTKISFQLQKSIFAWVNKTLDDQFELLIHCEGVPKIKLLYTTGYTQKTCFVHCHTCLYKFLQKQKRTRVRIRQPRHHKASCSEPKTGLSSQRHVRHTYFHCHVRELTISMFIRKCCHDSCNKQSCNTLTVKQSTDNIRTKMRVKLKLCRISQWHIWMPFQYKVWMRWVSWWK